MKKWSVIAAITVFAFIEMADLIHDFIANDPIGYFTAEPRRLLYVAAIAIAGGLGALGFYWLSPLAQRRFKVFSWGAAASTMTAVVGYSAFRFLSISSFILESGGIIRVLEVLLLLLLLSGLALYFWFEFRQAWKKGAMRCG